MSSFHALLLVLFKLGGSPVNLEELINKKGDSSFRNPFVDSAYLLTCSPTKIPFCYSRAYMTFFIFSIKRDKSMLTVRTNVVMSS